MLYLNFIRVTKDNINKEPPCCAISGKQGALKKAWLKQRFDDGLVFYRSEERGKCFIEYIPAENAWAPIEADGYIFIDCLWVSGEFKGKGYSNMLLSKCICDASAQGKNGICILSSSGRKKEFHSDPKYLAYKGFSVADCSDCGITLMYLPLKDGAAPPKFKDCAKHPKNPEAGFVVYYTDQCPFAYYWVSRIEKTAQKHKIPLKTVHITAKEAAQNAPTPITTYALFKEGKLLTTVIQSDKKFLTLAKVGLPTHET